VLTGLVLRARSGFYTVQTADGLLECQLRGRMRRARQASDLAVIGDRVQVMPTGDSVGAIEAVEERRSKFSRRQAGPRGTWREDVIVANADQVVVVFACADPEPHLRMVDRFLVIAEENEIEPVLVANKVDLVGEEAARELFGLYDTVGYPVLYTSARRGIGGEELAQRLASRISVVVGPSGVGKSTLLNAIQPGLRLATAEVSDALHKGRHTTTTAELHPLDAGGYVADTPGLRGLALWEVDPAELPWHFPEFRPFLGHCGFNDCSHLHEPDCMVRAGVEAGDISPERYESYRRMRAGEER
jgi:ribosome biogenesis GTPase / thiamine phosphate phosphatase